MQDVDEDVTVVSGNAGGNDREPVSDDAIARVGFITIKNGERLRRASDGRCQGFHRRLDCGGIRGGDAEHVGEDRRVHGRRVDAAVLCEDCHVAELTRED